MVNTLQEGSNNLVPVDYSDLLNKILAVINHQNPFKLINNGQRLIIDFDRVASEVVKQTPANPLLEPEYNARSATVNFKLAFKDKFPHHIKDIKDCLQKQLEAVLPADNRSIENFVLNLTSDLTEFKKPQASIDLSYPFTDQSGLQKQRLSLNQPHVGTNSLLKLHKLTITVDRTQEFNRQLDQGLETYLANHLQAEDADEQEELTDILKNLTKDPNDANSDYYKLKRLVDTEVVGQLKRQAKIKYLEHINDNIDVKKSQDVFYLRDLIRRLKLIDTYLNDPNKVDGDYEVNYHGVTVNLRQVLSRAEAFDSLPIIPLVEGYLGETTDQEQGKKQFIFGVKLKLNGKVQARGGSTSFAYHLNLINPDSDEHKEELKSSKFFAGKVLKLFFLYYFVFSSRCQPESEGYHPESELTYYPVATFEEKFLPILQGNDEEKKKEIFRTISTSLLGNQQLKIQLELNKLKSLLHKFIDQQSILKPVEYLLHIGVPTSILESDIDKILDRSTFFKDVIRKNPKEALQYLTVTDAQFNQDILCQLPVKMKFEDIRYHYHPNEKQTFNLGYDLEGIKALPVLFLPENDYSQKESDKKFKNRSLLVFTYDLQNDTLTAEKAFVYRLTFSLLTYICLKILVDVYPKDSRLFIPLLRLHLKNQQKSSALEGYMSDYSKVLAHLLNEEHLASSQGFDITKQNDFKTLNGLSSLYSVIPKHFRFNKPEDTPKLNKLAIIIVSSRESDSRKGNANRNERISNLMGEVITVNLLEDGGIKLETLKTFSENYPTSEMYSQPSVLLDQITHLYYEKYQHILYIAKAPYSSSLNLTQQEDDDGLFFLSRNLIKYLTENYFELSLYPIFFDKYYVRKLLDRTSRDSLYIQDSAELTELVNSQQSVVFFNLFNGTAVDPNNTFYHGVISYATLLNIYPGILDDEELRMNLIYNGDMKKDILQYLTLFHFSRYEASKKIQVKLDPYQHIIGDDSLGKLALFKHSQEKADFNSLAFLTEVKKILNAARYPSPTLPL